MFTDRSIAMPKERQNDINRLDCKYLFHQHRERGHSFAESPHTHPFWQLEIIFKGSGFFITNGQKCEFSGGDAILIPSGLKHIFNYPGKPCKWLSIKFMVENYKDKALPAVFRDNPTIIDMQNIIKRLLPRNRVPDNSVKGVLNSSLKIFMQYYEMQFGHEFQKHSAFLDHIFEYVANSDGKYITVNEVADAVGLSSKYTSERFKREAGCTLKKYLDEERFKHARRLLSFSENTISAISEQLDFSDVYSFSRFFKHWAKQSPRQFREHQLKDL
jgi:AraC family transcriptional activator of pobA